MFLFGGLGVDSEQNGLIVIYFVTLVRRGYQPIKTNNTKRETMCVLQNTEARSCNQCCSGKAISNTHSECVFVVLGIQHEMRMSHIVISGLTALQYSSHYLTHGTIYEKKLLHIKCVF